MKIKNKILMMAFTLIAFLSFGVINVNAATINVNSKADYLAITGSINYATEDSTIVLNTDITLEASENDSFNVYHNIVLDLNGHTITLTNLKTVAVWYRLPNKTFTIKNGNIVKKSGYFNAIDVWQDSSASPSVTNNSLIIDGVTFTNESSDLGHNIGGSDTPTADHTINYVIKNSTFTISGSLLNFNNMNTSKDYWSLEIENTTIKNADNSTNIGIIPNSTTLKYQDIIDTSKSMIYGDETLLTNTDDVKSNGLYNKIEIKNKANTHTVTTPSDFSNIVFATTGITEPTIVKLGGPITLNNLRTNYNDTVNVKSDLTIDLNGELLTLNASGFSFNYFGSYTVKIINSGSTGGIISDGKISIFDYALSYSYSSPEGTNLILDGISWTKNDSTYNDIRLVNTPDNGELNLIIKNSNIKTQSGLIGISNKVLDNYNIDIQNGVVIEPAIDGVNFRMGPSSINYSDLIDTTKNEVLVKSSQDGEYEVINPSTYDAYGNLYGFKVVSKSKFEVTAPPFANATYGYSSISAKPISIKAIGENRTIQSVNVDNTDKFQVFGTGTPTVNAGTTNTGFTIKPKDGLSAGTHTATITVSDGSNTYPTTVTFVVNKVKLTKPSFTSYTPFIYDGTSKTVAVTGFDNITMKQDGPLTGTDVGNYSLSYTIRDKNNYEWTDGTDTAVPLYWQITKASLTLGLTQNNWNYKGTAATPVLTGNTGNGAVTYKYKVRGTEDSTYSTLVPTNAGEYTIRATVAETTNYLSATKTADFVINKKEVSVENSSYVENKTFDDSDAIDPTKIHITLSDADALFTVTGTSASKYVGTGIGTNLVVTLTDDAYKNFTFASNSKTLTVTDKTHSIISISRDFENTTSSSSKLPLARGNSIDLGTLITPSDVDKTAVTYVIESGQTGTTLTGSTLRVANDGTLGTVKVTATLPAIDENSDGTNEYVLRTTTIYVDVVDKTVVTISGLTYTNRAYNGNAIESTGTLTVTDNLVPVSELDVIYNGINGTTYNSTTAPTNAGKYEVIYSVKTSNPSYTGSKRYEFEITKANPSFETPSSLNAVVGTQLHSITLPTGFSWETADTTLTAGTKTYIVTYTPSDTANYNVVNGIEVSVYVKNKFDLTTSVNGGIGGTISATKTGIVEGTEETVTFTPATGYRIAKVLVNNVETAVSGNSLNLTMNKPYTVDVTYEKISYTLDVEANANANINLNGSNTVYHGDSRNITITANHGYELISVKVNNVEKIADMSSDTLTLSSINEDTTIEVEVAQITYNVVEGKNQNFDLKDGITSFVVKADGEYLEFSNLLIDGTEVNGTLYDVTEGSTIITFNADGLDFLKELPKGEHTLTFVYEDGGVATTNFTINDSTKTNNPRTGDNIILFVVLGLISLIGLGSTVFVLKRRKNVA